MNKRSFVQQATANSMTWLLSEERPDFGKVVEYAELAWQRLCEAGHGDVKGETREAQENWYGQLQGEAKRQFDAFWNAFSHKFGKQRAALSWLKLMKSYGGDIPRAEAERIIDAAKQTALDRGKSSTTPAMAELWLNERRFDDYQMTEKKETKAVESIQAQIKNLRILARHDTSGEIQQQIRELEEKDDG